MLRLVVFIFLGLISTLALLGNKNGRASQAQRGNTGAPGDETQGGQPKTCISCHNQGPIVASLAISVLDSAGNSVTQYIPGRGYTARVSINASGNGLNGYGFQMIGLRDSNNSDLDGFTDVNPNNYKIATIPGGRTYAEHNNISATNTFDVKWTAPVSGTGSVTFYAAGNGVNSNGGTGGDGSGFSTLKLSEFSTASQSPEALQASLSVYPNPIQQACVLSLSKLEPGAYELKAWSADGQLRWEAVEFFSENEAKINLPVSDWPSGICFITLKKGKNSTSVKVLKL